MGDFARHYERAFEHFLQARRIPYVAVDQAKKAAFAGVRLKSFDYIVYPGRGPALLADVKGRKLESRRGRLPGQTWTTTGDVEGLSQWEEVFGSGYLALFVFAYWLVAPPAAGSGVVLEAGVVHQWEGRAYSFWAAQLAGYRRCMRPRSARWQTVYVPRRQFSLWAQPFDRYLGLRTPRGPDCGCDQRPDPSG